MQTNTLTFAEEILLLLLDDEDGTFLRVPGTTIEFALAGAVMMDLAFANRIDTDLEQLVIVDPSPTGNEMLDNVLQRIVDSGETKNARAWIYTLASEQADSIREQALESLVNRGILERHDEKFLWVFRARRYPTVDGKAQREAKLRIMGVLLSDDIPDPRDVALICLVDACDVLHEVLSGKEIHRIRPRIDQIRNLDLIGREVANAVADIEQVVAMAMAQTPH